MFRRILAAILGVVASSVVIMVVEQASSRLFPMPVDFVQRPHAEQEALFRSLPPGAFLMVLLGWILGAFVCGLVIGVVSRSAQKTPSYLAGLLLTMGGIVNVFTIWHPIWMVVGAFVVFIPMTLLGHLIAQRLTKRH